MPKSEKEPVTEADPLLTRDAIVQDLRSIGLPISRSWVEKLCMRGEGPPVDQLWGRRPMTLRSNARAWARRHMEKSARRKAALKSAPEQASA